MHKKIGLGCILQLAAKGERLNAHCSARTLRTGAAGILQVSITSAMEPFSPDENPDRLEGMAFVSAADDGDEASAPCDVCLKGVTAEDVTWRRGAIAGVWTWKPPSGTSYLIPIGKWATITARAPGVLLMCVIYDELPARERLYGAHDGGGVFVPVCDQMDGVGVCPADYATIGVRSREDLDRGALALDCRPGVFFHRPWKSDVLFPATHLDWLVVMKWIVDEVWWAPGQEGVLCLNGCARLRISDALTKAVQSGALPLTSTKPDGTCCACIGALLPSRLEDIVWEPQGCDRVYVLHP